ncbi:hypothetical protein [Salinimonas sediminis]|uniref:Uncharacterized protein n=1 Tax=Salinimonas sediminis TaxID=2303538 RepID=A0A346NLD0_9ALTE|nr:hypothetical protein [Salinimonas sediminis]AXR06337.1 hypothetical protein D0Y50_08145 [Salinimonas sediminis]
MTELTPCGIPLVSGGIFSRMLRFGFSSAGGGMAWDGMKYAGSQMIGLSHNASHFGAATNRL